MASHLAACDECRRAVAIASSIEVPAAAPVNEILLARVVAASRRRRFLPVAAAAAAVLAIAVGLALKPKSDPVPAPTRIAVEEPIVHEPVAAIQ